MGTLPLASRTMGDDVFGSQQPWQDQRQWPVQGLHETYWGGHGEKENLLPFLRQVSKNHIEQKRLSMPDPQRASELYVCNVISAWCWRVWLSQFFIIDHTLPALRRWFSWSFCDHRVHWLYHSLPWRTHKQQILIIIKLWNSPKPLLLQVLFIKRPLIDRHFIKNSKD